VSALLAVGLREAVGLSVSALLAVGLREAVGLSVSALLGVELLEARGLFDSVAVSSVEPETMLEALGLARDGDAEDDAVEERFEVADAVGELLGDPDTLDDTVAGTSRLMVCAPLSATYSTFVVGS
jgi:hypothetical protein